MKKKIGKGKGGLLIPIPRNKNASMGNTINLADPNRDRSGKDDHDEEESMTGEVEGEAEDTTEELSDFEKLLDSYEKTKDITMGEMLKQLADQAEEEKKQEEKTEEEKEKDKDKQTDKPEWTRYLNAYRRLHALGVICGSFQSGKPPEGGYDHIVMYIPVLTVAKRGDTLVHSSLCITIKDAFGISNAFVGVPAFDSEEKCKAFIAIADSFLIEFHNANAGITNLLTCDIAKPYRVCG